MDDPDLDDEALDIEYEIDRSMKDKRLKCLISYQGIMLADTPFVR